MEVLWDEGGGGDGADVTFMLDSDSEPSNDSAGMRMRGNVIGVYLNPAGASVTFTQHPANVTVGENRAATLTAAATGTSAYGTAVTYQWQHAPSGSTTFTNIAGATSASYTTPLLTAADHGAQYRVVASVPTLSLNSQAATVTISSDSTAPTLVSAGTLGNREGVRFNELVEEASATTLANYSVAGGTVTAARLAHGSYVILDLSSAAAAGANVTVRNVKDLAGNPMAEASLNASAGDLQTQDIGTPGADPLLEGYAAYFGNGTYIVAGGGSDIWNNADAFHYACKQFTGAFDIRARVTGLSGTDVWTKAALMARESLEPGSRHIDVVATRSDGNGQNQLTGQWRETTDGSSASLDGALRINLRDNANYPNTWIRLVRENANSNVFKAYWSNDGTTWNMHLERTIAETEGVLPASLYVGIAVTSHTNADTSPLGIGAFESFTLAPWSPVVDPQLSVSRTAGNVVITWASGTLVASPTVGGTYSPVTGASSPYTVAPQGNATFYKIRP
jgi:hypothetical protein